MASTLISRLELKNWRNFRGIDVRLAERVFVIGPNAAGKSNLLDSFRFLRDIAKPGGGLQNAISQRGGLSKVRCLSARRDPDVEIAVEISETDDAQPRWRYEIGVHQQVRGYRQPVLRYERVFANSKLILSRPDADDKRDQERLTQTHLEQINANSDFREVGRFFETIKYLHLVPQLLRHPKSFQGSGIPDDPFGRDFLELVARTSEKTRKARLRTIESALREAVPNLENLTDTKDESGVPHLEALYKHWRPNGARQREDQFSDGTLRMIAILWMLLDGDAPLLLEEPELSLHSQIVKLIPRLMFRIQRRSKRQILVSTHSWDLLSDKGIGGEEVVVLTPTQEGTEAALLSSDSTARPLLEKGLSIAEVAIPRTTPTTLGQLALFE